MSGPEFKAWPKTPRLFRDVVITEKIDGTNAAIIIEVGHETDAQDGWTGGTFVDGIFYKVGAQSRNRVITPGKATDNFGFAQWVRTHADELVRTLGVGRHFGEWWGRGIARGYGLDERRFSLFNVARYGRVDFAKAGLPEVSTVPVLARGEFTTRAIDRALLSLSLRGSVAAPGFLRPEGVVAYHSAADQVFKVLLENDHAPKGALISA